MLVFFPWLRLTNVVSVEQFTVIPVTRGLLTAGLSPSESATVDLVLEPYVERGGGPVGSFSLVKSRSTDLLEEPDPEVQSQLFDFGELLAFASMAARGFFPAHGGAPYSSRSHFHLVAQRFDDPAGGVAVDTRRRDGGNTTLMTRSTYRVHKPDHVAGGGTVPLDLPLLNALLLSTGEAWWPPIWEAILSFNLANTDNSDRNGLAS